MKPIRIAQIGVNTFSHGADIYNTLKSMPELFDLVGVVLPEGERERLPEMVQRLGDFTELTLEEVLNDPTVEAIAMETDEIYLTKYAQMVADAGKHMHMEKPGALDLPAFEKLVETVKTNETVFHTGYMYRYNAYIKDLLQRVKAGELGQIISVEAQMNCWHPEWARHWVGGFPGGMMFFLGCHLTDLILQFQGQPKRIIPLNKCTGMDGVTSDDFGMVVFEYENGVSFAKTTDIERGGYIRRQLVVTGTKGTVELRPLEALAGDGEKQHTGKREVFDVAWGADNEFTYSDPRGRYDLMMQSFAAYVRGEKENPYTPDYELELYKTVLKTCGVENV